MSYVDSNLMKGEEVIHKAKLHWIIYMQAVLSAVIGIAIWSVSAELGILMFLVAIILGGGAWIRMISTELAVTNKRVIVKVGLIRRQTAELNHAKVESFNINQGILGRILGYGTVLVSGTGSGQTPVNSIADPLGFRRKAMASIDASQG
jgi:uncharacterized membrane protein YdbT with pleckstrin-like domain